MTEIAQAQPMDDFIDGQRDCKEGKPFKYINKDHESGYNFQYQLEQNQGAM